MAAAKSAEKELQIPEFVVLEAGDKDASADGGDGIGADAVFRITGKVAVMSVFVKNLVCSGAGEEDADDMEEELGAEEGDDAADGSAKEMTIPLPNVKSSILRKVIEFCEHYQTPGQEMPEIAKPLKSEDLSQCDIPPYYVEFVNFGESTEEQETLFNLILAANYLDIKPLLDLTCAKVASMIKGKTPQEIRSTFNIADDFTPEEEAKVRADNPWLEDV
jgi:S-phase kinase-associated protein 1